MEQISVLCYGDSNTWGFDPVSGTRLGREERWPGVLQALLGERYHVIEEGLGGRTTVWDDPLAEGKNGRTYLVPCLDTHQPLDVVIIMLGTNDVQARFAASASEIAWGAEVLVALARRWAPVVLLIAPPRLGRIPAEEEDAYSRAAEKLRDLPARYRAVAERNSALFLDGSAIVPPNDIDGVHFPAPDHRRLAEAVAPLIREATGEGAAAP